MANTLNPTAAEKKVIAAAKKGGVADLRAKDPKTKKLKPNDPRNDPAKGARWGKKRTVRAQIIYALCVDPPGAWPVHAKGVFIVGAKITHTLDFDSATLRCRLALVGCFIENPIILLDARTRSVFFHGSHVSGLVADRLAAKGGLFLRNGFTAKGEVRLMGADIGGDLDCTGGTFENPGGDALSADGLFVKGNVNFRDGFTAKGAVWLLGANIGGDLNCVGGTFENPGGDALSADRLVVNGDVHLSDSFTAKGAVRLPGTYIGGSLICDGGTFHCPGGGAISADRLAAKGSVFLRDGFTAWGEVRLLGADIGGSLNCIAGTFDNPGGSALSADRIVVKGSVDLRDGFTAKGEVGLVGANISGSLDCGGGTFDNPGSKFGGIALNADAVVAKGDVNFGVGFTAKGAVRLLGADIGGDLACVGGNFENPNGDALNADGLVARGSVFLRSEFDENAQLRQPFTAKGEVRLVGADIGGDLECIGATFQSDHEYAFTAERATVKGTLTWLLTEPPKGAVSLVHARIGQLLDDAKSWPKGGKLFLDGFDYGALAPGAPTDAASRKNWLLRQPKKINEKPVFFPQPYEHLIRVLRRMGHEHDAREIAIAKQEDLRESGTLTRWGRRWNWILSFTIGHGYKPRKAVPIMLVWIFAGFLVFLGASWGGYMAPTKAATLEPAITSAECTAKYPCFQPVIYSLDMFLPIVDLHQVAFWLPSAKNDSGTSWGWLFLVYMWLHIAAGWVLTTIFVVGLTGIIRKD